MERRLAAILAADVVGYTRLMGVDEAGTLQRLTELRQQVLEPLIAEHHGRVVKLMGDGLLDEFARDSLHRHINSLRWSIRTASRINAVLQTNCKPQFLFWIELSVNTSGSRLHHERDVR